MVKNLNPVSVATIIVTYNGVQWLDRCIGSLQQSTQATTIIVVDNDSSDGTVVRIKQKYPQVMLIQNYQNLGFGQANNIGLKIALEKGFTHIFLLNQDAWVLPNTLEMLLMTHHRHPRAGIISCIHRDGAGKELDENFKTYMQRCYPAVDNATFLTPGTAFFFPRFVNAAAWLVPNECLQEIGGFDPIFFHYGEDNHFAGRALHLGYILAVTNASYICHDRAQRKDIIKPSAKQLSQKDWINLLVEACNPANQFWKWMLFKRAMRHAVQALVCFYKFDAQHSLNHFHMFGRICAYLPKVAFSRRRCRHRMAYLNSSALF